MKPIVSINDLSRRIGIPRDRLESIASNIRDHYDQWPLVDKRNPAKVRQVRSPRAELKKIQRLLIQKIFSLIPLHESVHGGLKNRSAKTNAERHLAQPCVVTLDIKHFYDQVRHEVVYSLFRKELGFGRDVARLLTRLTTCNDALPQGAPTSLAIANLLLTLPVDNPLSAMAERIGVKTTRFVDDLAFSGRNPTSLINVAAKYLSSRRLPIHRRPTRVGVKCKLKIMRRSTPQEVTGLLVNCAAGPSLSRARRDRVRSAINKLPTLQGRQRERQTQSITGRIQHVSQYNAGSAKRLRRRLNAVLEFK